MLNSINDKVEFQTAKAIWCKCLNFDGYVKKPEIDYI